MATKDKTEEVRVYTSQNFADWRVRMGYSADQASIQLGCAKQSVYNWERSEQPPRYIGLACDALALGINVIPMGENK